MARTDEQKEAEDMDQATIGVRSKLSALWATLMFLFIYADYFSLYQPGEIDDIRDEMMGPFDVTQISLLAGSVVVIVPAFMITLSVILPGRFARRANIALGAVFTVVNAVNLIGETWVYYWVFGILEIVVTLLIVRFAWKNPETPS